MEKCNRMGFRCGFLNVAFSAIVASGCAYRKPLEAYVPSSEDPRYELCTQAIEHPLYSLVPRHREQIKPYDIFHWTTWALVGNDDNGIFGELSSRPYSEDISTKTFLSWAARNPIHNLTFYALGSAERKTNECFALIRASPAEITAFGTTTHDRKWTWEFEFAFHDYKPYIGWKAPYGSRVFDGYVGWRHRGNFGLKFRPAKQRD